MLKILLVLATVFTIVKTNFLAENGSANQTSLDNNLEHSVDFPTSLNLELPNILKCFNLTAFSDAIEFVRIFRNTTADNWQDSVLSMAYTNQKIFADIVQIWNDCRGEFSFIIDSK